MAYKQITFDEQVLAGDKLKFYFSYSEILPVGKVSEQDLLDAANQAASFNVATVNYSTITDLLSLFGEKGTIEGTVTETTTANQIADDIRAQIANFKNTRGAQVTEVDKESFSVSDLSPNIPTTITFAAIAVIAIVILVFFMKLD